MSLVTYNNSFKPQGKKPALLGRRKKTRRRLTLR